jgi:type I restriction-modification system DNA methylase subunit
MITLRVQKKAHRRTLERKEENDTMSEELLQTIPFKIGKFTYYKLGNTTLKQLKNNGIIPKKNYGDLERKKPDGLVLHHKTVKAVIEYKQPKELSSQKDIVTAIRQELKVTEKLCKILIITDGTKSFWINAHNGEPIKDARGNEVRTLFHPTATKNSAMIEYLIEEINASITSTNSTIKSSQLVDPTPLANRLWQTIWVATGKSPIKCLYNVVELFIFKFLSDLKVLSEDISFNQIYQRSLADPENALDFYAKNTRSKIHKLFPKGNDGTTIINGTIFVDETGEPNLGQATLFHVSLKHLQKYSEDFGALTKINKQFKTRLYESFLKQEVEALGQYFTPRKVVQSVIRMGGLDEAGFQFAGKRICDPFCGVGGFLLETLNLNESMRKQYIPDEDGKIHQNFTLHGFDKGFERDDERTIILAKANMLIYLAELLFSNPSASKEFSRIFNETFTLFKDNLGTFGHIIKNENEKYDYILSNPPYVTKGSSIIKTELKTTPRTANEYPVNALGLEGIALEWIIKSLKRGGRAFIVIPDGILARVEKKLRKHILHECYLDAIVSLPERTFFANQEHTYIIVFTKKNNPDDIQSNPVFCYLASNIGERLTSVKRDEIDQDDLPEMERLFRIYDAAKGSCKTLLERESGRCKIIDIKRFVESEHWVVNRWWTREEFVALGIEEAGIKVSKRQIDNSLRDLITVLGDYDRYVNSKKIASFPSKTIKLGDVNYFKLFIGNRIIEKDLPGMAGDIPVYSANAFKPMGFIKESNIDNFNFDSLIWSIDGNFDFNVIPKGTPFATTDHCGAIQILNPDIMRDYLLFALNLQKERESFDRGFRASLAKMRLFEIKVPIKKDGTFDIGLQNEIADYYRKVNELRAKVDDLKSKADLKYTHYIKSPFYGD